MFLLMLSSHLLGRYNKCMMLSLRVGQLSSKIHAVITSGREGRGRERERETIVESVTKKYTKRKDWKERRKRNRGQRMEGGRNRGCRDKMCIKTLIHKYK